VLPAGASAPLHPSESSLFLPNPFAHSIIPAFVVRALFLLDDEDDEGALPILTAFKGRKVPRKKLAAILYMYASSYKLTRREHKNKECVDVTTCVSKTALSLGFSHTSTTEKKEYEE
jgi:hypothetical protein